MSCFTKHFCLFKLRRLYAHQQSYLKYNKSSVGYRIAVISDKDTLSKTDNGWESVLLLGTLYRENTGMYSVQWDDPVVMRHAIFLTYL